MVVCSPPFSQLYAYSSESCDIGNSEDFKGEAKLHLSYWYHMMARVVKPGRAILIHVQQVPRMRRNGEYGLFDFRGLNLRLAERARLIYEYDWLVTKNQQDQAIRNHARELQFAGLEDNRAACRGCLSDYLLKFRVPGECKVKVRGKGEVSRNDWIAWASAAWTDIIESDTLKAIEGRSEEDTRHPCPLQLETIRRLILMFTDPGEVVFSPFGGIGSESYMAIGGISPKTKHRIANPRRAFSCEIKPQYIETAEKNMARAERQVKESSTMLWDMAKT